MNSEWRKERIVIQKGNKNGDFIFRILLLFSENLVWHTIETGLEGRPAIKIRILSICKICIGLGLKMLSNAFPIRLNHRSFIHLSRIYSNPSTRIVNWLDGIRIGDCLPAGLLVELPMAGLKGRTILAITAMFVFAFVLPETGLSMSTSH